jgi:hypothetical protein
MYGDLLNTVSFKPQPDEIRPQIFETDEYGFRNRKGLLDAPIDAVMTGTSFVGGAQETQDKLISSLLIDTYKIKVYNYATLPLQYVWEDERFIKNKPKYIIVVGNETEILQKSWIEALEKTNSTHPVKKWQSYDEWEQADQTKLTYTDTAKKLQRFSIIRHYAKLIHRDTLNSIFSRKTLAGASAYNGIYDSKQDMIFWDINNYDPTLNANSEKAIQETIEILTKARDILKTRNIKLLVAVMPSKSQLYGERFVKLPIKERALVKLEEKFDEYNINYVPLFKTTYNYTLEGKLLYYPDDGHWNTKANEIIAKGISEKIKEIEKLHGEAAEYDQHIAY